ncbi:MAG: dTDP-4-dehydrorhamnose 3,5-epimerase [Saprospiraceae bacterium]|nr:dTDP-4-dehydrorhamnose 3,5-epimerase [Saprospiraceae bacterium]
MEISTTGIEGLLLFKPKVFEDTRGYFYESFREDIWQDAGILAPFVQDNQAYSTFGALRGLHYQTGEKAQAKLVRVILGEVLDVAVDLRSDSPTFGRSFSVVLSGENHLQMYIPRGFAHGYLVRSPEAIFTYKCDNYYSKEHEGGLRYNDPQLNIDWGIDFSKLKVSDKDLKLPYLGDHLPID